MNLSRLSTRGLIASAIALSLTQSSMVWAQSGPVILDVNNWASVTTPVVGTSEKGAFAGTELFAGPNKFGSYYSGVLPNGRTVKPAGISAQTGMNPLGMAVTADGKYVVTTNNDEREGGYKSYQVQGNVGGYSITVHDATTLKLVAQFNTGNYFIGLQVTGTGPYTIWASGGPDNDVKVLTLGTDGTIKAGTPIKILPITPADAGYVSNYTPDAAFNTADASGVKPGVASQFARTGSTQITFPAGSAVSPDGKFLYVACNGDNSLAVIDTAKLAVVKQIPVGYFPYGVSVSSAGDKVFVANWGIMAYSFYNPIYDPATRNLVSASTTGNLPDGFYVPPADTVGRNPKTSSVTVLSAPKGDATQLSLVNSIYQGMPLDAFYQVGDTHPSATAIVKNSTSEILYVAKTNSDRLGLINVADGSQLSDLDLSPISIALNDGHPVHGAYPNALAVSPDNKRLYVAEAGLNSVAVIDTSKPAFPAFLGRIPTGWYPTALAVSPDGKTLYVANAKGIGEDINPAIDLTASHSPSGVTSDPTTDSNYLFGSIQRIDVTSLKLDNTTVLGNNFAISSVGDTSIVPAGGSPSGKIKTVVFIEQENKTFDSMLGNLSSQFGAYASLTYNNADGTTYTNKQYTGVSLNTQKLASTFATAVNYYSESEESDAGHQFCASGTASDYTEKTLLVKSGRGLLVNKNFEPEDYPEAGYIFNNAARNGVSFKVYGDMIRIQGTDTGTSSPTTLDDPTSGKLGYPTLQSDKLTLVTPLANAGDTETPTQGLGQTYFMSMPILSVLGQNNSSGEPHLDVNYPGYNFNISDQRRAQEFIKDFDRMLKAGTLPQYIHLYLPNDHTGGVQAPNAAAVQSGGSGNPVQQIADGDVALGMVVNHMMGSPAYYDPKTGNGMAIFMTYDDAQSSLDHIHPHRTPLIVVSPYAKPAYLAKQHYSSASIVKTEELILGLPPNNLGDLFATDLRDMFQSTYNGITAAQVTVTRPAEFTPSPEANRIWALVNKLDTSAPDRDSYRLGALARLTMRADEIRDEFAAKKKLKSRAYRKEQTQLYLKAIQLVNAPAPRDPDGD